MAKFFEVGGEGLSRIPENVMPPELLVKCDELIDRLVKEVSEFLDEVDDARPEDRATLAMTAATSLYITSMTFVLKRIKVPEYLEHVHDEVTKIIISMIKEKENEHR